MWGGSKDKGGSSTRDLGIELIWDTAAEDRCYQVMCQKQLTPLINIQLALTNSMKQKRRKDNSCSPCQEIRRILSNPEDHNHVKKARHPFLS